MARIRTIKPELASDIGLAQVSIGARYTFVLMITQADDAGLLPGSPRQLLGALYPHDEAVTSEDLATWVGELVTAGQVRRRCTVDGAPVVELVNWTRHQRLDNAGKSALSMCLAADESDPAATRGEPPQDAAKIRSRALDLGPRTIGEGEGVGPVTEPAADDKELPADAGPVSAPSKPVATRAAPKMSHDPALYAEVKAEVWEWLGLGDRPSPGTAKNADTLIKVYLAAGETGRSVRSDAALWPREWPGTEGRPPSAKQAQDFRSRLRTGYRPGERRNGNGAARATAPPDVADDWGWGTEPIPADPTLQEAAL